LKERIARRQATSFTLELDDLLSSSSMDSVEGATEMVERILHNTKRYEELVYDVINRQLLPSVTPDDEVSSLVLTMNGILLNACRPC
jgi:hypothetical protein